MFKIGDNSVTEEVVIYRGGIILGEAISTAARRVTTGRGHGKVASVFVHKCVEARKETKRENHLQKLPLKKEAREIRKEEKGEKEE